MHIIYIHTHIYTYLGDITPEEAVFWILFREGGGVCSSMSLQGLRVQATTGNNNNNNNNHNNNNNNNDNNNNNNNNNNSKFAYNPGP
jgi:hypothetical protein